MPAPICPYCENEVQGIPVVYGGECLCEKCHTDLNLELERVEVGFDNINEFQQ